VSAHAASDGITLSQADLGRAFSTDILYGWATGRIASAVACGELVVAAGRGQLIGFSLRHCGGNCVIYDVFVGSVWQNMTGMSERLCDRGCW